MIEVVEEKRCQDYGDPLAPNCLKTPDPQFTMDFTDIGEGYLYWCSSCGPRAHLLDQLFTKAISEDPKKLELAKELIEKFADRPCEKKKS